MMNNLLRSTYKSLLTVPKYNYHFPNPVSETHSKPGLVAKRLIRCINQRLQAFDPDRWNGVPISYQTNFRDEGGYIDVETSIQIHEAIEREFNIEIHDRHVLITDIETALHIVLQHHDSV